MGFALSWSITCISLVCITCAAVKIFGIAVKHSVWCSRICLQKVFRAKHIGGIMPLTRPLFHVSDVPCDVIQMIADVLNKIETMNCKLDTVASDHELLKNQVNAVESKLECLKAVRQTQKLEGAHTTRNINSACSGIKTDFQIALDAIKEDYIMLRTTVAEISTAVESQNLMSEELLLEHVNIVKIQKEVEQYNRTGDWHALRSRLKELLDIKEEVYRQLQSIEPFKSCPLWRIGFDGHTELAKLLLCAGLPVEKTTTLGDSMLHGAAQGGHLQLVILLVNRGAEVNVRGRSTNTPLMWAAAVGHLEVVKFLVSSGADIYLKNREGHTARHCAETYGKSDVVQYLDSLR